MHSDRDRLTREEAVARAGAVSNVTYDIDLELTAGAGTYRGSTVVRFHHEGDGDVFLNFRRGTIETLDLNGEALDPQGGPYRLVLPADRLSTENEVRVVYENPYDHTGEGLHQAFDPEDGAEYLHSQFEAFAAHRVFPCFDQPDVKAHYDVTVTAPAGWLVTSAGREEGSEPVDDGMVRHRFERMGPFSSYLMSVVAGPYEVVRDDHDGLPLALYCRKSLRNYLDPDELFAVTKAGMDFYGDFFAQPYPFTKYDQLFVPEFNAGAMENVGNVTIRDYYVFRDPPTEPQKLRRAETILHELAHMWFGDLVTMRWWDDLWLNESFATFMSYLAMERVTEYRNAWLAFHFVFKDWAYDEDELPTTHRIADELPSTDEMFLNFDGITYGKGAAVLRQLVASVGEEAFREGMRTYFRRFAWGNASLTDFLAAVGEGGGIDLAQWSKLWLESPSLNTLAAEWESAGNTLTGLRVRQTAPADYPTLRPHYAEVVVVDEHLDRQVYPVRIDGELAEIGAAVGTRKPALVFPNHGDLAYAKVRLDRASATFARARLNGLDEPLLRQLLWTTLWQMTRDREMSSTEFLSVARTALPLEQDVEIIETGTRRALKAVRSYVPEESRHEEARLLVATARAALQTAPPGDARVVWMRTLIGAAADPEDLRTAAGLVDGHDAIEGLTIDQDMRWQVALRWAAYAMSGAEGRARTESERDPSDRAKRMLTSIEVAHPDPAAKTAAWERLVGEGYGSLYMDGAAMRGFNWTDQRKVLEPFVPRFFDALPAIFDERPHEVAQAYFTGLFPAYRVDREAIDLARGLLARVTDAPALHRMLLEAIDEQERALACREYAAGS